MKKTFKIIAGACAVLLLALVAFMATFDAENYKGRIEKIASDAVGEKVTIGGPLSLGFASFRPALAAHDVTISEAGKDTLIEIGTLDIALDGLKKGPPWRAFVEAGNLRLGGKAAGDYKTPLIVDNKGVDAPDIRGSYGHADVTGKASYRGKKLHVELKAKGLDYGDVTGSLKGGNVGIDFTADAHGTGSAQLTSSLRGRLLVIGGKGEMSGRTVDFWGGELLTAFVKSDKGQTSVNCVVGDFGIVNGVLAARHAVLDTDTVAIFGSGNINLARKHVDMRFTPQPKERAILNIATPMLASGPFGNVKVTPDPQGMAATAGKFLLGAVNPAMAIVPYVLQDTASKNVCVKYLREGK